MPLLRAGRRIDILVRSNCYCYALSRYVGSYCEPGLGATGNPLAMPVRDCSAAVAGVLADGARSVDRNTVYTVPTSGSYIALAVKPPSDARDTGDYHFWRLDADNTWSYKAGDTLSRNTYRNGTLLQDIERADARGAYTQFCGYFEVRGRPVGLGCCLQVALASGMRLQQLCRQSSCLRTRVQQLWCSSPAAALLTPGWGAGTACRCSRTDTSLLGTTTSLAPYQGATSCGRTCTSLGRSRPCPASALHGWRHTGGCQSPRGPGWLTPTHGRLLQVTPGSRRPQIHCSGAEPLSSMMGSAVAQPSTIKQSSLEGDRNPDKVMRAALRRSYYADAGWEDGLPSWALAKERAAQEAGQQAGALDQYRKPPHTYSVRPYQLAFGEQPVPAAVVQAGVQASDRTSLLGLRIGRQPGS